MAPSTSSTVRIGLDHLMYVRYRHPDISRSHQFLTDFGFITVKETPEKIWYRGFGADPVCYISEQSSEGEALFLGAGWSVNSYQDLEEAAKMPGASSIVKCDSPVGGQMVTLKDPAGGPMYLHWDHEKRSENRIEKPKVLTFNTWDNKRRKGEFQRLPDGPANIHKLGHYGYEVSHEDFPTVREWYFDNFTLAPTDSLFDPKTGKDIMTFAHVDKGEEFTDHHSFFVTAGDGVKSGYEPHHASFEVDDFDSELKGHAWLEKKGWDLVWGVGRHLLGSQIFDYWFDPDGFVVEHYADGDLVNCHNVSEHVPATPDSVSIWGPNVPLAFLTRKTEDKGKTLGPPPPAQPVVAG